MYFFILCINLQKIFPAFILLLLRRQKIFKGDQNEVQSHFGYLQPMPRFVPVIQLFPKIAGHRFRSVFRKSGKMCCTATSELSAFQGKGEDCMRIACTAADRLRFSSRRLHLFNRIAGEPNLSNRCFAVVLLQKNS